MVAALGRCFISGFPIGVGNDKGGVFAARSVRVERTKHPFASKRVPPVGTIHTPFCEQKGVTCWNHPLHCIRWLSSFEEWGQLLGVWS